MRLMTTRARPETHEMVPLPGDFGITSHAVLLPVSTTLQLALGTD